tara:strand:- start:9483 stop:10418 length:936 start_codon:yes stop_codon:yes gene_type:complete
VGKVSIIIATYNRASFITETLYSIKKQSFKNWECIIVDDCSNDSTSEVVSNFIKRDNRFSFHIRPNNLNKGANVCRNFGFNISTGEYIKYFDSDDIMSFNHLEVLVSVIEENNLDFAVGNCRNFDKNGLGGRPYEYDREEAILSAENFALFQVAWITDDLLVKRFFAEKLRFAEGLRDQGSEYHYNLKLLSLTTKGALLSQTLTYRRIHENNLIYTEYLVKNDVRLLELKFTTMQYVDGLVAPNLQRWFLSGFTQLGFKMALEKKWPPYTSKCLFYLVKYYSIKKAFLYPVALFTGFFFKKGYFFIKYIRS